LVKNSPGRPAEYLRRDLLHETAVFRASAIGSFRKYYLTDLEFSLARDQNGREVKMPLVIRLP
jgi:hypothetical protein